MLSGRRSLWRKSTPTASRRRSNSSGLQSWTSLLASNSPTNLQLAQLSRDDVSHFFSSEGPLRSSKQFWKLPDRSIYCNKFEPSVQFRRLRWRRVCLFCDADLCQRPQGSHPHTHSPLNGFDPVTPSHTRSSRRSPHTSLLPDPSQAFH